MKLVGHHRTERGEVLALYALTPAEEEAIPYDPTSNSKKLDAESLRVLGRIDEALQVAQQARHALDCLIQIADRGVHVGEKD